MILRPTLTQRREAAEAEAELRKKVDEYYRQRDAKLEMSGFDSVWKWNLYSIEMQGEPLGDKNESDIYNLPSK